MCQMEPISGKLLSGKELIEQRNKEPPQLPTIGLKEFAPCGGNEEEAIEIFLTKTKEVIEQERVKIQGILSEAVWCPDIQLAEVKNKKGSVWVSVGHTVDTKLYLYPEEALYLLELGLIELKSNKVPISIERGYHLLLTPNTSVTMEQYKVYSHLKSQGLKILRHSSKNSVTEYEKQLHVHKLGLKHEHTASSSTQSDSPAECRASTISSSSNEVNFPVSVDINNTRQEILKKLQIFEHYNFKCEKYRSQLHFNYDLFVTCGETFKKTFLQLPRYRIIVLKDFQSIPTPRDISSLSNTYHDNVPIIYAIVFPDNICYYQMDGIKTNFI